MCQTRVCKVEDCTNHKIVARGLCSKHYTRFMRHGTCELVTEINSVKGKLCEIDGCSQSQKSKGYCDYHYFKLWQKKKTKVCKVDGCNTKEYTMGYCQKHYSHKRQEEIARLKKLG
ncbi:hypothetical protein P9X10_02775 [Bacillus cereus]|nr:hypothetical protein [Bacillus cereus]